MADDDDYGFDVTTYDVPDFGDIDPEEDVERVENTLTDEGGSGPVRGVVTGANRISRPFMTKFEEARLIETYAKQIDHGAPVDPRIPIPPGVDTGRAIAALALRFRAPDYEFPVKLHRPVGNVIEEWLVSELVSVEEQIRYGLVQ